MLGKAFLAERKGRNWGELGGSGWEAVGHWEHWEGEGELGGQQGDTWRFWVAQRTSWEATGRNWEGTGRHWEGPEPRPPSRSGRGGREPDRGGPELPEEASPLPGGPPGPPEEHPLRGGPHRQVLGADGRPLRRPEVGRGAGPGGVTGLTGRRRGEVHQELEVALEVVGRGWDLS